MAKNEKTQRAERTPVKFKVTDGKAPTRRAPSGVFNMRLPFDVSIPSGSEMRISLGVSCNYPLHVFETASMVKNNIRLIDGTWTTMDSETEISLFMRNTGPEDMMLSVGETVARACVIDNNYLCMGDDK